MSKPRTPVETRFWPKVQKSDGCWPWTATTDNHGYGQIYDQGKRHKAHRVSYELANGPIPDGLSIDHICYTRACVRPDHLQAVTNKANIENRASVNRNNTSGARGVSWHKAARKWMVSVHHARRNHYGGLFVNLEDAKQAAIDLRASLFTNSLGDKAAS